MTAFKPMLASPADFDLLRFPVYASPKLDGIRASVVGGKLLTRTLKEVPNRHVFSTLSKPLYEGLDGELIVGSPLSPSCMRDTTSGVMSINGEPDFEYHVFDWWSCVGDFQRRKDYLEIHYRKNLSGLGRIVMVPHTVLNDQAELEEYEARHVGLGHEGIMLARPDGLYKHGRATARGGELLKVKRFQDSEALVIGVVEEMFNGNEAEKDNLGRTKRSKAKDGLSGKGTMGALQVRDRKTGVEFEIGTGFTAADRAEWWDWWNSDARVSERICKYKFFPVGVKDKPRHPVFLGLRNPLDL